MKNRPTYKIWDKENNKFYEPTYEAYNGKLEELLLSPGGDLIMRKMNEFREVETIHESRFPDRFEVIFDTDINLNVNNQDNTSNFQGTINYEIK